MNKLLTIEVTDVELKALEGITARLERYRSFIPVGLMPVVEKMEAAIANAKDVERPRVNLCTCGGCHFDDRLCES